MTEQRILITGGCGFIGSALVRHLIKQTPAQVLNVDVLTYAANPRNLAEVESDPRYAFERIDICDAATLERAFDAFRPTAVVHLAAETHVDRSIDGPMPFVQTNVVGSATLLQAAYGHWRALPPADRERFRFLHVSTDEVYGSIEGPQSADEECPYRPNSPYAASKAGADHLARAWHKTYGLPVIVTNCSNNFGPYQFPEKLIPLLIINGLEGRQLPIYGRGENVRDWLYVEDHARALACILQGGKTGECYNVSGSNEWRNIDVAHTICDLLDAMAGPLRCGRPRRGLIGFVADRPGHDARYALDGRKLAKALGWRPSKNFADALRATVAWYLANEAWWAPLREATLKRVGLGAR